MRYWAARRPRPFPGPGQPWGPGPTPRCTNWKPRASASGCDRWASRPRTGHARERRTQAQSRRPGASCPPLPASCAVSRALGTAAGGRLCSPSGRRQVRLGRAAGRASGGPAAAPPALGPTAAPRGLLPGFSALGGSSPGGRTSQGVLPPPRAHASARREALSVLRDVKALIQLVCKALAWTKTKSDFSASVSMVSV